MEAQAGSLDVVAKFGAKADLNADLSKPLLDAWKEAYASPTPTKIVIPEGTYLLSQATLEDLCKAPIELQVQGNIKAPTDPKYFKEPKWVSFLHVENFKLFGGGAFDGQGTTAYKREVTCGPGHGIIGSLGKFSNEEPVEGIKVSNCTLTNTSNGVRIKTWAGQFPGTASDIYFEDITVTNEESNVKLSNISFKNIHGTAALPEVVKLVCSGTFPCENVELADIDITFSGPDGPAKSECKNVKPKITGKQNPAACSTPVPENPTPTV
ncbi:Polygalacturonase [Hibiscus syriacus]|uniref:Polygalacturonase n=1 Tax=Hibiscus syriacus TaxID=106335 RepID=A0A6A2YPZ6_HIBSY|nr:Polygalacturonase [Hibiscus syriacus]